MHCYRRKSVSFVFRTPRFFFFYEMYLKQFSQLQFRNPWTSRLERYEHFVKLEITTYEGNRNCDSLEDYDKLSSISEKKDKSEKRHFNYSMYLLFPVLFLPVGIAHPLSLKRLLYGYVVMIILHGMYSVSLTEAKMSNRYYRFLDSWDSAHRCEMTIYFLVGGLASPCSEFKEGIGPVRL